MISVLLIGMGKFGRTLGEKLLGMGDEVMIVDKNEDVINSLGPKYADATIANCTNEENLAAMDVKAFNACVVAIGDDFQSSLEVTSLLKDLGAKRVISRATTDIQRKLLLRMGADEVIYPDMDIAEKLAVRLNSDKVINYIDIDSDYSIFEIAIPNKWIGRKLIDINPRKKYGMNILTVKKGRQVISSLDGNYVFENGDQIVVFGDTEKILAFANKTK
ncbi:MAG: TrkA family potassium uptake protein [Clostridia bacterium]|nr:TrkA family potassium uptake protein [Clostridia bacterium]